ncbi:hypothetical protein NQZ68_008733 [Dissostichus eleginoides]|nr:hypothetical protein NQZ68_008733 [Dissostichus eleginoides]
MEEVLRIKGWEGPPAEVVSALIYWALYLSVWLEAMLAFEVAQMTLESCYWWHQANWKVASMTAAALF